MSHRDKSSQVSWVNTTSEQTNPHPPPEDGNDERGWGRGRCEGTRKRGNGSLRILNLIISVNFWDRVLIFCIFFLQQLDLSKVFSNPCSKTSPSLISRGGRWAPLPGFTLLAQTSGMIGLSQQLVISGFFILLLKVLGASTITGFILFDLPELMETSDKATFCFFLYKSESKLILCCASSMNLLLHYDWLWMARILH